VGHVPGVDGAFHIKAAVMESEPRLAAVKINGNFPNNPQRRGLPTIQGCIALADAEDGRLLALMDSIEITAQRTAAASALAARHLARRDAATIAFVGCGTQARYHLAALLALDWPQLRTLQCFDVSAEAAAKLCASAGRHRLDASVAASAAQACRDADIVVTTTPAAAPIIDRGDLRDGCFVAAVGADNPAKCEMAPALMAHARVVPDITAQAETMGDLRAAIAAGAMRRDDVHAELAQIVSGQRAGRTSPHEIFVFDSTGTAIQDLAAASIVYQRASADAAALRVALN
jgi:ornithine cyclodeaminase/alanine dehydrogenase-like protein (mu-crystallin family)